MRCYLVRHAQTDWNRQDRLQGHSDLPLNDLGREQARAVGAYFAERSVRAIYTSHLARSRETASAIARETGLAPIVREELAEIHLGAWEGLTPDEVDAKYDGAFQRWRERPSGVTIPHAEPLEVFLRRVQQVAEEILAAPPRGDVVMVTHGGAIAALLSEWLQADYDCVIRRLALDNGGISAVNGRVRPPHVLWVNATAHLVPSAVTI